jgi:hypothetical protein
MSAIAINTDINGNCGCGGDFSRPENRNLATEVAPTKIEQEALV